MANGRPSSVIDTGRSEHDMDILAARKKAAEQANARNKPEPEAVTPAEQTSREPEAPAEQPGREPEAPAEQQDQEPETPAARPRPEPEAPPAPSEPSPERIVGSPAASGVVPALEETRDKTGVAPVANAGESAEAQQREVELLSFRLGGEVYAVLVADVREVLKTYHLTTVPNTPHYILGVMSLRGAMLPIIDLCKRFGLAPAANDEKSRIVVVSSTDEEVGLLVDQVTGVFRVLPDEIKPVPENLEQGAEFLRGIVRTADRLHILLDLGKALGV
jgi:purine-binding chemotaxis protein CheW